jgi:hypothetical protein
MSIPSAKDHYRDAFRKEHATTLKIMKAFPAHEGARMKDGRVPSIYGPSLDEPWT